AARRRDRVHHAAPADRGLSPPAEGVDRAQSGLRASAINVQPSPAASFNLSSCCPIRARMGLLNVLELMMRMAPLLALGVIEKVSRTSNSFASRRLNSSLSTQRRN